MKLFNRSKPQPTYAYGEGAFKGNNDTDKPVSASGKPKIVFFGTGPVAAKSLQLLASNFEVEAVITKPKPSHHRGNFPVIEVATELNLPVETAPDKHTLSSLIATKSFQSRLGVLIDFGIIVNEDVINHFPLGIVNSHFSLLPRWRGADPISFAILNGDDKTGVSLMLLEPKLDTGKLIAQKSLPIKSDDTTPSLTDKLINLSHELITEHLPSYVAGQAKVRSQPHPDRATYSRKLSKADGLIDWTKPAEQIEREIRAFIDWPKSRTTLAGKEVIITKAHTTTATEANNRPGEIKLDKKAGLVIVSTAKGALCIEKLKPAGKQEMSAQSFMAGYGRNLN